MNKSQKLSIQYGDKSYSLSDLPEEVRDAYNSFLTIEQRIQTNNSRTEELKEEFHILSLARLGAQSILENEMQMFIESTREKEKD